jgi:hypothetical protein
MPTGTCRARWYGPWWRELFWSRSTLLLQEGRVAVVHAETRNPGHGVRGIVSESAFLENGTSTVKPRRDTRAELGSGVTALPQLTPWGPGDMLPGPTASFRSSADYLLAVPPGKATV